MWGWKPTWYELIVLTIFVIISTIFCLPCFLLQKIGFKAKYYAEFLEKTGLEQLSFFGIKIYHK